VREYGEKGTSIDRQFSCLSNPTCLTLLWKHVQGESASVFYEKSTHFVNALGAKHMQRPAPTSCILLGAASWLFLCMGSLLCDCNGSVSNQKPISIQSWRAFPAVKTRISALTISKISKFPGFCCFSVKPSEGNCFAKFPNYLELKLFSLDVTNFILRPLLRCASCTIGNGSSQEAVL
jgi:hypothetical protein